MPQTVSCENCDRQYVLPDRLAGRSVQCKDCEAVIRVPELSKGTRSRRGGNAGRRTQRRKQGSAWDSGALTQMGLGLVGVLVVGAAGLWLLGGGSDTSPAEASTSETENSVAQSSEASQPEPNTLSESDSSSAPAEVPAPVEEPGTTTVGQSTGFAAALENPPATDSALVAEKEPIDKAEADVPSKPEEEESVTSTKYKLVGEFGFETEPVTITDLSFGGFAAANPESPIFVIGGARPVIWKDGAWQDSIGDPPAKKPAKKRRNSRSGPNFGNTSPSVRSSKTSQHFTTMSADGVHALIDWNQGLSLLNTVTGEIKQLPDKSYTKGRRGVISADGTRIVIYMSDGSLLVRQVEPGKVLYQLKKPERSLGGSVGLRLFVSNDGERIYYQRFKQLYRFSRGSAKPNRTELPTGTNTIVNLKRKVALITTQRKSLVLADIRTGEILDEMTLDFSRVGSAVVFNPSGNYAALRTGGSGPVLGNSAYVNSRRSVCLLLKIEDSNIELLGALPTVVSGKETVVVEGMRFLDDHRIALALKTPTPLLPRGLTQEERAEAVKQRVLKGRIAVYELPE